MAAVVIKFRLLALVSIPLRTYFSLEVLAFSDVYKRQALHGVDNTPLVVTLASMNLYLHGDVYKRQIL